MSSYTITIPNFLSKLKEHRECPQKEFITEPFFLFDQLFEAIYFPNGTNRNTNTWIYSLSRCFAIQLRPIIDEFYLHKYCHQQFYISTEFDFQLRPRTLKMRKYRHYFNKNNYTCGRGNTQVIPLSKLTDLSQQWISPKGSISIVVHMHSMRTFQFNSKVNIMWMLWKWNHLFQSIIQWIPEEVLQTLICDFVWIK
jgi:hypothetical protein